MKKLNNSSGESFEFVCVLLTYNNENDLVNFFKLNEIISCKFIVVNSFFSTHVTKKMSLIAEEFGADFIPIDNLGYSYGNNIGISYAIEKYKFNFLIVCNSDIKIIKFKSSLSNRLSKNKIYAPKIKTLSGKNQNPFIVNYFFFFRWLYWIIIKSKIHFLKFLVYLPNGISRRFFNVYCKLYKKFSYSVYSCHGSFIILGFQALQKLNPVFNDNMFLYQEEHFFARKAFLNNIEICYIPHEIEILHYEDGSVDFNNERMIKLQNESYNQYFDFLIEKKIK